MSDALTVTEALHTPFVVLSASPDAESVIAACRLRVFDFAVKSDDMQQLIRAVAGAAAPGPWCLSWFAIS